MNRLREKTVITVETFQRTVVRSPQSSIAWCRGCGKETTMISLDEAALDLHVPVREIFRRIEAGEIHFSETESGALLVCSCQVLR